MLHGDTVCVAREAQRQKRHVQQSVTEAAQLFKPCGAVAAQDANRLLGREAVMSRGNRCMRGEDAMLTHLRDVGLGSAVQRAAAELALKQRQSEQRRVAFVHVIDIHPLAERLGHAHAAHAEHDLPAAAGSWCRPRKGGR